MENKWTKPDCAPEDEWVSVAAEFIKSSGECGYYVTCGIFEFGNWFDGSNEIIDSVVAWRPLPEYQEGDEN